MSEPLADVELVNKALAGDAQAFVQLVERHKERVWRIAASVANPTDAEDLAQEVIIRAYRALTGYQKQAPFAAWLCRIAINAAHDYQRSAWQRRVSLVEHVADGEDSAADLHDEVERREVQRRVRQAVACLPDHQRIPIWLHYFEGFNIVEVARLERAPEATVRSRMRAGMHRLSLSLDDLMPDERRLGWERDAPGCGA